MEGNVTSEPSKISNIFNDFFVNVADEITKTIPKTHKSPLDYLSNRTSNSLFLTPVTFIEVNDLINTLRPRLHETGSKKIRIYLSSLRRSVYTRPT